MFFLASKVLDFLLDPLNTVVLFLVITLVFFRHKIKRNLIIGICLLYVFGNPFLTCEFVRLWETEAVNIDKTEPYDYGIVLSGMMVYDPEFQRINFHGNVDRLLQALPLHAAGQIDTLILSGGDGSLLQNQGKEAKVLYDYLSNIGYDVNRILIEPNSKNTFENAKFTDEMMLSRGIDLREKKTLLITSSVHMKRSEAIFNKQGITVQSYATNRYAGKRKFEFDHLFIPKSSSYHTWKALLHEVVGFAIYSIMGYI